RVEGLDQIRSQMAAKLFGDGAEEVAERARLEEVEHLLAAPSTPATWGDVKLLELELALEHCREQVRRRLDEPRDGHIGAVDATRVRCSLQERIQDLAQRARVAQLPRERRQSDAAADTKDASNLSKRLRLVGYPVKDGRHGYRVEALGSE